MKIAFICDSGTARTVQELREQGIFSCPLQISDDQNNYLELEDKTILEIYDKVDNGEMLKTSLPPMGVIDETIEEIQCKANSLFSHIRVYDNPVVMVQGEFTLTYQLVKMLQEASIRAVASTQKRISEEVVDENGNTVKVSRFHFEGFRDYYV
jgi:nicotinate-nucleotide pyrophosphorylase